MKKSVVIVLLGMSLLMVPACTNMSKTQQGAVSGGAIGAGAGLGIGALTGGSGTMGAVIGGAAGAVLGGLYGHQKDEK